MRSTGIFIWGTSEDVKPDGGELSGMMEEGKCIIVPCRVKSWMDDFSPWEAETADGRYFGGRGEETLAYIRDEMIPEIRERYGGAPLYIAGYSLSGLFALWAFTKENIFDGCVCCSGSMWFPGFKEYIREYCGGTEHSDEKNAFGSEEHNGGRVLYLSLGGKESITDNPVMAAIGDDTREVYELLKGRDDIAHHKYEMNRGGHFANPGLRVKKGISYVMSVSSATPVL